MDREETGRYEVTTVGGEDVRAFIPAPLPPLVFDGPLLQTLEMANLALGRLDGATTLLPDRSRFRYLYVRKEAVLSSQIEGTQSSLADLLLHERDNAPGVPQDDLAEVSRYVAALEHGLRRTVSCSRRGGAEPRQRVSSGARRTGSAGADPATPPSSLLLTLGWRTA